MAKLTALHIQRYLNSANRLDSEGRPTDERLSSTSLHSHYRTIHAALSQAVKWGYLTRNVADAVKPPRRSVNAGKSLTTEQLDKLLAAAAQTRLYALYLTAIATGMR